MNGLNDQIRRKIMKQKMVGHESAAIVTYKELEEWANKADELVKNCSIPDVSNSVCPHPDNKRILSNEILYCENCMKVLKTDC